MRKILLFILLFISVISLNINAQEKKEPTFGIKFSGFVKNDVFYDTRQGNSGGVLREGHFYLYPDPIVYDVDSVDLNDKSTFNMLSIQSRLKGNIFGPDAFGAKTSGVIEAEFFGNAEADINGFRLRHAFMSLNWKNTELLSGQTWHPIFSADCYPGTISFNTGAPFIPFSRNPQVKVSHKFGPLALVGAVYSQRDFCNLGPDETDKTGKVVLSSSKYMRNSSIPGVDFQIQLKPDSTEHAFGIGIDYKSITPEIKTTKNYQTNEQIGSIAASTYLKLKFKPITVKVQGSYIQNGTDLMVLGGYAVKQETDTAKGFKEYTTINTGSAWMDITTNGTKVQVGIFAGYSKNLGSMDEIKGKYYSRGANIDHLYRVSSRVNFISGKFSTGAELEMTTAGYGTADKYGKVKDVEEVTNFRILFSTTYNF